MIVIDPAKAAEVGQRILTIALQEAMDNAAIQRGYDSLLSACSYAAQPAGAPFQAEGAAFVAWRSAVWAASYQQLEQVRNGAPMPTVAEAIAAMPGLQLPV